MPVRDPEDSLMFDEKEVALDVHCCSASWLLPLRLLTLLQPLPVFLLMDPSGPRSPLCWLSC